MSGTTWRLTPHVVKGNRDKKSPFFRIASPDGTLNDVTWYDLDNASDRAAGFLDQSVGEYASFVYYGPNDVRYIIWILAAMKTGKCVILPSPSNVLPATLRLFETVEAKAMLYAPEAIGMVSSIIDATKDTVHGIETPRYEELMSEQTSQEYTFDHAYEDFKDVKFMALHTSGTSGHPKPLYFTHAALATLTIVLDPGFRERFDGQSTLIMQVLKDATCFAPFPLFHFGSLGAIFFAMHCDDSTMILPAPGVPLSPQNICVMLEASKATTSFLPPVLLEPMLRYPEGLQAFQNLDHVAYAGGPLNPALGSELAAKLKHLAPVFASSEGGAMHLLSTGDSRYWNAFNFCDLGHRMEEVSPGMYELVIPRTDLIHQAYMFFHTQPHLKGEFRTKDLFSPLDNEPGWWVYKGRADNWIAMSNGLKMDPTDMENQISASAGVKGTLVAGSNRFRLCMLIEMQSASPTEAEKESLWPVIEEANMQAPKFGRVPRELVMFATPEKPFLRAGKGTIQRRLTIEAYQQEINERYDAVEEGLLSSDLIPIPSFDTAGLLPFLTDLYAQNLQTTSEELSLDEDLFARGLDSLTVFVVLAQLKAALRRYGVDTKSVDAVDKRVMYMAPTVRRMADTLLSIVKGSKEEEKGSPTGASMDVESLIEKYAKDLPQASTSRKEDASANEVVVLTGSTGSLGSYILASLLEQSQVSKVYCLNRSTDAGGKQKASFQSRGLKPETLATDRVVFLQAKLDEQNLGLSQADYSSILEEATSFIHNSYPVNFLLSLDSFEPQIAGLIHLIRAVAAGQTSPSFLFVSSISTATTMIEGKRGRIEEAVLPSSEAKHLLPQGYARSKYVCERLLERFAAASPDRVTAVLRVGQICGPVEKGGTWNKWEWFPSLVLSSKYLGVVPNSLNMEHLDWIPVDQAALTIAERPQNLKTSTTGQASFVVCNVNNPKPTRWEELLPIVSKVVPRQVTPEEWIRTLEESTTTSSPRDNPALKLADFLRDTLLGPGLWFDVCNDNYLRYTSAGSSVSAIGPKHLEAWMQAWGIS